ncbi:MAG: PKD domain-containing protein [Prevotella sp.]|nr:PKD domain-containing protein [Prevotella sp.]
MIKRIIYIVSALIFLCTGEINAQRETYNWIFGDKAGLTWNTTRDFTGIYVYGGTGSVTLNGMPTNITSPLTATQGCFTLSDRKGKLLLFSNGSKLYNANKVIMNPTTDMVGNIDNAQSGILFPYPDNPDKYVAVTTGRWSNDFLGYTIIDMKGNSGLGNIESMNNSFPAGRKGKVGSSITSTRHANGVDYWVIAPGKGTPSYINIWRFTPDGIAPPQSFQLPANVEENKANGYFKISPDGKHFVWGTFSDSKLFFGNFDNATGTFSNIRHITSSAGGNEFYGVEFSMSGKYMYVSKTASGLVSEFLLYVFDFDALINSSNPQNYYQTQMKRISFPSTSGMPAALQLGPDGRMYISGYPYFSSPASFYVIENPEQYNNLKIYRLDNFLTGSPYFGLPSFAASWFELKIGGETEFCLDNVEREYTLVISKGVGSEQLAYTQWNFGDGSTLIKDYNVTDGNIQSYMHAYNTAGNYTITVTSHKANGEEITAMGRQTLNIKVLDVPSFTVTANDVCIGESGTMTVNITGNDFTINWYNSMASITPIGTGKTCSTGMLNAEGTVTFYVEVVNTLGCSSGRVAVNVTVKSCGNNFIPVNPHIRITH